MKAALAQRLSGQWQVKALRIQDWEVVSREPRQWRYHVTATVLPTEDLYKKIGTLNDTAVLAPAAKAGEVRQLSGTAQARFDGQDWDSQFSFDGTSAAFEATPKSAHGGRTVIVSDPKFPAFLASAEAELQKREATLGDDDAQLSRKIGEWNASNQVFNENVQQAKTGLDAEQRQLQQDQQNIRSTVSREVQAANLAIQQEMRERTDGLRKDLDARTAALSQAYRGRVQALQSQYRDLPNQRLTRDEYSEKYRQLRDQDSAMQKQYREQLDRARDDYANRIKALQQESDARRAKLQDDITASVTANVERSGAALQEKRQQQQGDLDASQSQLVGQRSELERRYAVMQAQKTELTRQRQLLEQLKNQTH
ncbi:hypothetical protein [Cupriavidus pauculus]|uniref:Uncharacterized protein n=1 Tax=Cupriavidus pauculus TaxID=82633 RepID=A0A2N5C6Q5_9BURK|nr:hypothetical protein [Cupriavidus pauculus]PLP97909.1 hypothetical protein CYJ10_24205 [Cupriavidus pauculus]